MRRTFPALPVEPTEPAPPLSQTIEGQHAPRANPEPRTLNPEPFLFPPLHFPDFLLI